MTWKSPASLQTQVKKSVTCTCTYRYVRTGACIIHTIRKSSQHHFDVISTGSFGGGQSIVVSGRGFSTDDGAISITVCGEECDVTDATTSAITCTTPSNTGECKGSKTVNVLVFVS